MAEGIRNRGTLTGRLFRTGGRHSNIGFFTVFCVFAPLLASAKSRLHTEKMKRRRVLSVVGSTLVVLALLGFSASANASTNADLKRRLEYCGSIPNGSSFTVVDTTRLFIFLPKDLYPRLRLNVSSHEATAFPAHNDGSDGYAQTRDAKPGCWSHYFEFDVASGIGRPSAGIVDIGAKSAFKTVSNYLIHFKVVVNLPSAIKKLPGNGTVIGRVILGPICPVERIPPDSACAPKPYKTMINIFSTWTGSSYKSVSTDANGSFKLSLSPGVYSLEVSQPSGGSLYPRCAVLKIFVVAKKVQNVTVNCDTGIR